MNRTRVLLAEDHRGTAELLKSLLARDFDLVVVAEDGMAMVEAAKKFQPDVIVLDRRPLFTLPALLQQIADRPG